MTTGSDKEEVYWVTVPEGTLLGIRRPYEEVGREQWAVLTDGNQVRLQKVDDDGWTDVATYPDILAVFAAQPVLARQRPGQATYFDLSPAAGIGDKELVALLDPCADEASDSPDWAEDAGDWEDLEIWDWVEDLDFLRRLVAITDSQDAPAWRNRQVSWIDNGGLVPVFVDEDGFIGEEIASFTLNFTGNSMVGGTSGARLTLVAPGLAVSVPTGEAHEVGEFWPFLIDYPDGGTTRERAEAVADWLKEAASRTDGPTNFGLHAAFQFEPFDPNGTLDEDDEHELSVSLDFDCYISIPSDVTEDFREVMDIPGSEYAYTKEALADPRGRAARTLAEADRSTFYEGAWEKTLQEEDGLDT